MRLLLLCFALVLDISGSGQERRYTCGPEKGFLRSSTEHITVEVEEPFEVRSVAGRITRAVGDLGPLEGVAFEIRGPGDSEKVQGTLTDRKGNFRLRAIEGTYRFKATMDGFQSIVGTITVSKRASRSSRIDLAMRVGV